MKKESFVPLEPVCDTRLANCHKWYLIPPQDINMRIPDNLKKCVVFIGIKEPQENMDLHFLGLMHGGFETRRKRGCG